MNAKEKYEKVWRNNAYRLSSQSEQALDNIISYAKKSDARSIIDIGAGTGRAALQLHSLGYSVMMLDIAENSLDLEVGSALNGITFRSVCSSLFDDIDVLCDFAVCVDVLEHVEETQAEQAFESIFKKARHGYIQAATQVDRFGPLIIGEPLHTCVKPGEWWACIAHSAAAPTGYALDIEWDREKFTCRY